jgi:hypothetical protein
MKKGSFASLGGVIGAFVGFNLTRASCNMGRSLDSNQVSFCLAGAVLLGVLGAILGALLAPDRKGP